MLNKELQKAVIKFQNGDGKSFDYIYDKTYKLVYFIINGIVKDNATTEELVQETYLKIFNNISAFSMQNFIAWISVMAKNIALNEYNRRKKEVLTDFSAESNYIPSEFTFADEDSYGLIRLAQQKLDETDYQILIMCVVSGYKRREVAQILDMPISTISYRLKTSLDLLKKYLEGGNV